MARPTTEPFAEEVHTMKVLYQHYNKRNDVDAVTAVEQELSDVVKLCTTAEADIRQTIKELSKQVTELEGVAAYPHREGLHAERVAALQRQIDLAKQAISEMDTQSRSADQECEEVEKQLAELANKEAEALTSHTAKLDFLNNHLSLYQLITSTIWWADSTRVCGAVSDTKKSDIRTFSFDKDMDKYEMVNKLWELL